MLDNQLDGVLGYLEDLMKLREIDSIISDYLSKIMLEDDNLLKCLV